MAKALIDAGVVAELVRIFDEDDTVVLIYLSRLFSTLCPLLNASELILVP